MSKINPVIIDYGVGNIFSLKNAIEFNGHKPFLTNDLELIDKASHIFLPGVGSFEKAIEELKNKNLFDFLKKCKNKKIMGICLGMQLLFEKSFEMGEHLGLGLLKGVVDKIEFTDKNSLLNNKVPNIGWHETKIDKNFRSDPIFFNNRVFNYYFIHSYHAKSLESGTLVSYIELGKRKIPAIVKNQNIYGCQFHPEKSRKQGLNLIKNFLEKI